MAQEERDADNRIQLGRIRAAIWMNHTEQGKVWFNIKITRQYLDGDGWRSATSVGLDDLPVVAIVAFKAYAWCWNRKLPATPAHRRNVDVANDPDLVRSSAQRGASHEDDSEF